jgi:hypothetical protein
MWRRDDGVAWGFVVLWVVFVGYAARFAPPDDPVLTRALLRGVFTGDFGRVDPAVSAVFSALGVVPVLASMFVLRDGATRRLPAWPFALAMFALGGFALLPWLALRGVRGPRSTPREPGRVRRLLARRTTGAAAFVALSTLGGYGLARGHATALFALFQATSMVHVMSIDLVVCAALVMVLLEEARATLGPDDEPAYARGARVVPLLGSALWTSLVRRAP